MFKSGAFHSDFAPFFFLSTPTKTKIRKKRGSADGTKRVEQLGAKLDFPLLHLSYAVSSENKKKMNYGHVRSWRRRGRCRAWQNLQMFLIDTLPVDQEWCVKDGQILANSPTSLDHRCLGQRTLGNFLHERTSQQTPFLRWSQRVIADLVRVLVWNTAISLVVSVLAVKLICFFVRWSIRRTGVLGVIAFALFPWPLVEQFAFNLVGRPRHLALLWVGSIGVFVALTVGPVLAVAPETDPRTGRAVAILMGLMAFPVLIVHKTITYWSGCSLRPATRSILGWELALTAVVTLGLFVNLLMVFRAWARVSAAFHWANEYTLPVLPGLVADAGLAPLAWVGIWHPLLHLTSQWVIVHVIGPGLARAAWAAGVRDGALDYYTSVLPRADRILSLVFYLAMAVFVFSSPTFSTFAGRVGLQLFVNVGWIVVDAWWRHRDKTRHRAVSKKQRIILAVNDLFIFVTVQGLAWVTVQILDPPQMAQVGRLQRVVRLVLWSYSTFVYVLVYYGCDHYFELGLYSSAIRLESRVDRETIQLCVSVVLMVTTVAVATDTMFHPEFQV